MTKNEKTAEKEIDRALDLDELESVSGGIANPAYMQQESETDTSENDGGLNIAVRTVRNKGGNTSLRRR